MKIAAEPLWVLLFVVFKDKVQLWHLMHLIWLQCSCFRQKGNVHCAQPLQVYCLFLFINIHMRWQGSWVWEREDAGDGRDGWHILLRAICTFWAIRFIYECPSCLTFVSLTTDAPKHPSMLVHSRSLGKGVYSQLGNMHWKVDEHLKYLINFPKRKYSLEI